MKFRNAVEDDKSWVLSLFDSVAVLGEPNTGRMQWHRFWKNRTPNERWIVSEDRFAFCHFRLKRDGSKTVYEIAVSEQARRLGYGRQMLEIVGLPVVCKTDSGNVAANAFYKSCGFVLLATHAYSHKSGFSNTWMRG